jgi:hypothetical protein
MSGYADPFLDAQGKVAADDYHRKSDSLKPGPQQPNPFVMSDGKTPKPGVPVFSPGVLSIFYGSDATDFDATGLDWR